MLTWAWNRAILQCPAAGGHSFLYYYVYLGLQVLVVLPVEPTDQTKLVVER